MANIVRSIDARKCLDESVSRFAPPNLVHDKPKIVERYIEAVNEYNTLIKPIQDALDRESYPLQNIIRVVNKECAGKFRDSFSALFSDHVYDNIVHAWTRGTPSFAIIAGFSSVVVNMLKYLSSIDTPPIASLAHEIAFTANHLRIRVDERVNDLHNLETCMLRAEQLINALSRKKGLVLSCGKELEERSGAHVFSYIWKFSQVANIDPYTGICRYVPW